MAAITDARQQAFAPVPFALIAPGSRWRPKRSIDDTPEVPDVPPPAAWDSEVGGRTEASSMRRGLIWIRRGRPLGVGDSQRLLLRRKSSESPGISFALIESVVGDLVGADGSGDF